MTKNFLTPEEVAETLQISKYTVYEMVKRGDIPATRIGRKMRFDPEDLDAFMGKRKDAGVEQEPRTFDDTKPDVVGAPIMFIGSHDLSIDCVIGHMREKASGAMIIPAFVGSMEGLLSLYFEKADIVGCHLLDEETGEYNIPFIKRMFAGQRIIVVQFVERNIGWIVPQGNPKRLTGWEDLNRSDLTFVNRQKGAGTRILFDYQLKRLHIDRRSVNGYDHTEQTHYGVASAVSRNETDAGLGTESAARALGLGFIPLTKERYDFVMKEEFYRSDQWKRLEEALQSDELKQKIMKLGGYDVSSITTLLEEVR